MNLNCVREPGGDEHFPVDWIPTLQAGAAKIRIAPNRLSQGGWNRRNALDYQVLVRTDYFILGEGSSGEEQDCYPAQARLHRASLRTIRWCPNLAAYWFPVLL